MPSATIALAMNTLKQHDDRRIDALCRWFDAHQRDLPWRRKRTGYTALVAELMLQQTQVNRVLEFYPRFLKRFPTAKALAAADEQDVLAHWQGLGYYRRARHLHAAAKCVVENYGGQVPLDVNSLQKLPGVGRYTAGSIASIVGGEPAPIVDGNVLRVLQRWDADRGATNDPKTVKRCWQRAEQLVSIAERPGVCNEALMELGALVCVPVAPKCGQCPVAKWCQARQSNLQIELPVVKKEKPRPIVHHHTVVIRRNGSVLLEQRESGGLWAGLWQPPTIETTNGIDRKQLQEQFSIALSNIDHCTDFEFITSSRRVQFHVYHGTTRARRGHWQPLDTIETLPMSNAHKKVLKVALDPAPLSRRERGRG